MEWVYYESNTTNVMSQEETENNATLIFNQLSGYGWTLESICGLLGNIETESYINPAQWQVGYSIGSTNAGFGLVQWTPSTKYTDWIVSINENKYNGYWQVYCIDTQPYGTEWLQTNAFPITYTEFKESTESVAYLTEAFLKNYERAGVEALENRISKAEKWYTYFTGEEPNPPIPQPPQKFSKMPIWFYMKRF